MKIPRGEMGIDPVIEIVERSNQRGGRMLSVVDLLEARTVTAETAARAVARLWAGSSLLVGATPGGAGKTTVMGAFLAMAPPAPAVRLAERATGWERCTTEDLVVAYEIGDGDWEGYVWGASLRTLCRLARSGVRVATNLHADTLEEAREQIVGANRASEEDLCAFGMFVPLRVEAGPRGIRRTVGRIEVADGGSWVSLEQCPPAPLWEECRLFLEEAARRGLRDIAGLRTAWLARVQEGRG